VPVGLSWPRAAASRSFGRNYLAGTMITKDFRTYSTKILRREKILRDHGGVRGSANTAWRKGERLAEEIADHDTTSVSAAPTLSQWSPLQSLSDRRAWLSSRLT
jgi:hypothetical protein